MTADELDINVGMAPFVSRLLADEKWGDARRACIDHAKELHEDGYQADGIRVVAGPSWWLPFVEFGTPSTEAE